MKKETRLYNLILPIWLLWLFPVTWPIILGGNLLVDGLVLLGALTVLKLADRRRLMKTLLPRIYLLGFAADAVGVLFLLLAASAVPELSYPIFNGTTGRLRLPAFCATLTGILISAVCIYWFDRAALKKEEALTADQRRKIALTLAVLTAPWTFFISIH